jgi:uncharacterized pyridoxal phosphate-containing UPF0001 family protein
MSIATNLKIMSDRKTSIKAGRDPKSVRFAAVTKFKPADASSRLHGPARRFSERITFRN